MECKDVLFKAENIFLEYHGTFAQQKQLIELLDIVDKAGFNYYINSANNTFENPFLLDKRDNFYDQQLDIFCTKKAKV